MIFRHVLHLTFIGLTLCSIIACGGSGSSSSGGAPPPENEHPDNYLLQHAAEASGDLTTCRSCHGASYAGSGDAVSCMGCHPVAPPFIVHPFNYSDPDQHGLAARNSQIECLGCHGTLPNIFDGGVVSDPTLFDVADANCARSGCHQSATAHPTNWQGSLDDSDPTYSSTHRTVNSTTWNTSCALCHNVTGTGPGANTNAPSCYVNDHTNANSIATGCHPGGP